MRTFIIAMSVFILLTISVQGQDIQTMSKETQDVARQGLATLMQLATEKNFKLLGFDSLEEVKSATLGEPLADFIVPLDKLKAFQPGSDPARLLVSSGQMVYPVMASGNVRSSVTVQKVEGRWAPVAYGGATLAALVDKVRPRAEGRGQAGGDRVIVRIPALNLYFLGHQDAGKLMLTPVVDEPRYELKAGEAVPAEKVFDAVLPDAKRHDGLPS